MKYRNLLLNLPKRLLLQKLDFIMEVRQEGVSENSSRCLYKSTFKKFVESSKDEIIGCLHNNYHGTALTTTNEAWQEEIRILQQVLRPWIEENNYILFEYNIPRLGKRIDVVLLLRNLIFCLEFKVGKKDILQDDIEQVMDYALDLKNFHLYSRDCTIVPILIPTEYKRATTELKPSVYEDSIYNTLITGENGLSNLLHQVLNHANAIEESDKIGQWDISPYSPTPTIVEAARTLYTNHSVEDITRHDADKVSTDATTAYILNVIRESMNHQQKSICFVTGVPGAGKTLVGLDVAVKQSFTEDGAISENGAVYLSGNGPLVAVLTEALAKDNHAKCRQKGEGKNLSDSRREVSNYSQV